MNDPKTQKQCDDIIKKFVETNGYSHKPIDIINLLEGLDRLDNAYFVEKYIEMLPINRKFALISDEEHFVFDLYILDTLLDLCEYYGIEMKISIDKNNLRNYSKEILEYANKLVEKLKLKEKYWMDNMPFNKNKQQMPTNKLHTIKYIGGRFGYLFKNQIPANEINTIAAHELGHGIWALKHTFDNDYGNIAAGTTSNLMDYTPAASHLAKWQWEIILITSCKEW